MVASERRTTTVPRRGRGVSLEIIPPLRGDRDAWIPLA